jgi:hypothetical protein
MAITAGWRRLHKEELLDLSYSQNIRATKSRRMGGAEHVACM